MTTTNRSILVRSIMMIVLLLTVASRAQAAAVSWANMYGGGSGEGAADVFPTSDGGYLAAGFTKSFGAQGWDDEWFVKFDALGNIQSQQRVGGGGRDDIQRLELTSDGGYVTVALSGSFGASQHAPLVLKFDSSGALQWQKNYIFSGRDWGNSIKQTSDGGYVVVGGSDLTVSGPDEPAAIKLDTQGNVVWQMFYGNPDGSLALDVLQTSDGGYLIAANTTAFGQGGADGWLIKTDATGNIQWQKTYGGTGDDGFSSLAQTSDGGYIVAGGTTSFGSGSEDVWVLKLNADGSVAWQNAYGGSGNEDGHFIRQTSDGGYIVGGSTTTFAATGSDLWALKLDATGTVVWQRSYDSGSPAETVGAIRQTSEGGYILAGLSAAGCPLCNPAPNPQYFTMLKLLPDGTVTPNSTSCPSGVGQATSAVAVSTTVVPQDSGAAAHAANFATTNASANIASTAAAVTPLCNAAVFSTPLLVGLGDSVAAGHGLGDDGNPSSYPMLVLNQWGASRGYTGVNLARDGATSADVLNSQLVNPTLKPNVVTLSVGADDIHFPDCMKELFSGQPLKQNDCSPQSLLFRHRVTNLRSHLTGIFAKLEQANPHSTILVPDYYNPLAPPLPGPSFEQVCEPYEIAALAQVLSSTRSRNQFLATLTLLGPAAAEALLDFDALGFQDLTFVFVDNVLDTLNATTMTAAAPYSNIKFVPTRLAFKGHDFCAGGAAFTYGPKLINSPLPSILPDFAMPSTCQYPRNPADTSSIVNLPIFNNVGLVFANCMPHPTSEGQQEIANGVCSALNGISGLPFASCSGPAK